MGINDFSAKEVINKLDEKSLEKIFKFFGEEKEAKKSQKIFQKKEKKEINTEKLVNIINKIKVRKNHKIHSATIVFQSFIIFVYKEISELIFGFIAATKVLKKDGVLAVVTFHSIEDKIVKYFFKHLSENKGVSRYMPEIDQIDILFKNIKKKPILPSTKELSENISSRSAKLRYGIKKKEFYDFETDIFEKFDHLIEIENLGKKL